MAETKNNAVSKKSQNSKNSKLPFDKGDYVVYPAHGVGRVLGINATEVAGQSLEVISIAFEHDRLTLQVPVQKSKNLGLRTLASKSLMADALKTLEGKSRVKKTMWSRRAQEYEAKINSGDPVRIAEVVRDLFRNVNQPDQSYSERHLYQEAIDRLAREFAAIEEIDQTSAVDQLETLLRKATAA